MSSSFPISDRRVFRDEMPSGWWIPAAIAFFMMGIMGVIGYLGVEQRSQIAEYRTVQDTSLPYIAVVTFNSGNECLVYIPPADGLNACNDVVVTKLREELSANHSLSPDEANLLQELNGYIDRAP